MERGGADALRPIHVGFLREQRADGRRVAAHDGIGYLAAAGGARSNNQSKGEPHHDCAASDEAPHKHAALPGMLLKLAGSGPLY